MRRVLLSLALVVLAFGSAAAGGKIPWDKIPGVKVGDFQADFISRVEKKLEELECYGRCSESVAACLRKNPPHATAIRLARDAFFLMAGKKGPEEIQKWIEARKRMAHPEWTHSFSLDGLVPLGKEDAPVVIVEFSDFRCPYCAKVAPLLEQVVKASGGKARLYFKQFPIKGRPQSLAASKASVAAQEFGKFWEYCRLLFANRSDLSDPALLALAKKAGMDPDRFGKEMEREEVLNRVADEKMEGLRARIKGTPTVFINGKEVLLDPSRELLQDRIHEELDILNERD
ncbi:thioredoxin domain-containing protein [Myxococcota bacterium]